MCLEISPGVLLFEMRESCDGKVIPLVLLTGLFLKCYSCYNF